MARKRGLELDDVVATAVALADAEGIDGLTMARVASALDVRSPSLYSHVDGLAGLRRAVALHAARGLGADMAAAAEGRDGADALRAIASAYRAFAVAHPGAYATILTTPAESDDPEVYAVFAAQLPPIVAALTSMGVGESDAIAVIRGFRSALHGFVSLEASGGFGLPGDLDQSFALMVDLLIDGVQARVRTRGAPRAAANRSQASPRRRP
jgi:AcrR family transcriptional regulator